MPDREQDEKKIKPALRSAQARTHWSVFRSENPFSGLPSKLIALALATTFS